MSILERRLAIAATMTLEKQCEQGSRPLFGKCEQPNIFSISKTPSLVEGYIMLQVWLDASTDLADCQGCGTWGNQSCNIVKPIVTLTDQVWSFMVV